MYKAVAGFLVTENVFDIAVVLLYPVMSFIL